MPKCILTKQNKGSSSVSLVSIEITTEPTKTSYLSGDSFDSTGMVVTATYSNGNTAEVGGYSVSPSTLTDGTTEVTITYSELGVSVQTTQAVTVTHKVTSIELFLGTNVVYDYIVGDTLDTTGITVNATYSDDLIVTVTSSCTFSPTTLSTVGTQTITVSYTENEVTVTTTYDVTVIEEFDWGDEEDDADEEWWNQLKTWTESATEDELADCVGKTKSVTLSTAVNGTTTHLVRCIGYNCDGDHTLTFQTANCLASIGVFGLDVYLSDSSARDICLLYYERFPGNSAIKEISKGTNTSLTDNDIIYVTETVFIPSATEMGINDDDNYEEYCEGYNTPYQYYTTNNSKIKGQGDDGTAVSYWTRSLYTLAPKGNAIYVVLSDGSTDYFTYTSSNGFAPAFVIGPDS